MRCGGAVSTQEGGSRRERDARRPNHSIVMVGKRPNRQPYASPSSALPFQRPSTLSTEYTVSWERIKAAATSEMHSERGSRR